MMDLMQKKLADLMAKKIDKEMQKIYETAFEAEPFVSTPNYSLSFKSLIKIAAELEEKRIKTRVPLKIIVNPHLTREKQTRFPKKKKNKRWVKKFKKKYLYSIPNKEIYWFKQQGVVICHPIMEAEIKHQLSLGGLYDNYALREI